MGICSKFYIIKPKMTRVRVAKRLALPISDLGVAGSNPAGGEILPEPKRCFIAQGLSCSPFHRLEMTEILLKGCKTPTHPSIHPKMTQSDFQTLVQFEQAHFRMTYTQMIVTTDFVYSKFFFSSNILAVRTPKIILKLLLKTFSFSSNSDFFHAFQFLILRTL